MFHRIMGNANSLPGNITSAKFRAYLGLPGQVETLCYTLNISFIFPCTLQLHKPSKYFYKLFALYLILYINKRQHGKLTCKLHLKLRQNGKLRGTLGFPSNKRHESVAIVVSYIPTKNQIFQCKVEASTQRFSRGTKGMEMLIYKLSFKVNLLLRKAWVCGQVIKFMWFEFNKQILVREPSFPHHHLHHCRTL